MDIRSWNFRFIRTAKKFHIGQSPTDECLANALQASPALRKSFSVIYDCISFFNNQLIQHFPNPLLARNSPTHPIIYNVLKNP